MNRKKNRYFPIAVRPRSYAIAGLLLVVMMVGCATSMTGKAYQVLHTTALTYDEAMKTAGDAYRLGLIGDAKKDEIVNAANKFRDAHFAGVAALAAYKQTKDAATEQQLTVALEQFQRFSVELLNLLTPYLAP